jgi:hypothetical protein
MNQMIIGLLCSVGMLWISHLFRTSKENEYNHILFQNEFLEKTMKQFKIDQAFLLEHKSTLAQLKTKKWTQPESRVYAGRFIEDISHGFEKIEYAFKPQKQLSLDTGINYKVTEIVIRVLSYSDSEIYSFIETMIQDFPGILFLSELELTRRDGSNFPCIEGKLTFDWLSQGDPG